MRDKSNSRRNSKKQPNVASIELVPLNRNSRFLAMLEPFTVDLPQIKVDLPQIKILFNEETLYKTFDLPLSAIESAPIPPDEDRAIFTRAITHESSSFQSALHADQSVLHANAERFTLKGELFLNKSDLGVPASERLEDLFKSPGPPPAYQSLEHKEFGDEHCENKQRLTSKGNGIEIHIWLVHLALNLDAQSLLSLSEASTTTCNLIFSNQALLDQLNIEKRSLWIKQVTRYARASFLNRDYVEKNMSSLLTEEERYNVFEIPHQPGDQGFVFR